MFVAYWIKAHRPFREPFANQKEFFNELSILISAYPLFFFTNWVWDMEMRINAGWFLVGCIILNIIVNIALLVVQTTVRGYRSLKFWCIRRKKISERKMRIEQIKAHRLAKLRKEQEAMREQQKKQLEN